MVLFVLFKWCELEVCLCYCHWWCYLSHVRQVLVLKNFHESLDGKNIFYFCLVIGNLFYNQFVGIGDGHKCIRDRLNLDLISDTVSPVLDFWCDSSEDYAIFVGRDIVKVGWDVALYIVMCPFFSILSLVVEVCAVTSVLVVFHASSRSHTMLVFFRNPEISPWLCLW